MSEASATWFVTGKPVGQPRATPVRRGKHSWMIEAPSDHGIHAWKRAIVDRTVEQSPDCWWAEGVPLDVQLRFRFPAPQRLHKQLKLLGDLIPHTSKPDTDNLAKAVLDALTKVGNIWHDDRQIVHLDVDKHYCHPLVQPGVLITVRRLVIN